MRPRQKPFERHPAAAGREAPEVHLVARIDRLGVLEHQMRSVFRELHVQLTRIAQLQFELDTTRHAVDALMQRLHRR
jgi:hypothetical protein